MKLSEWLTDDNVWHFIEVDDYTKVSAASFINHYKALQKRNDASVAGDKPLRFRIPNTQFDIVVTKDTVEVVNANI